MSHFSNIPKKTAEKADKGILVLPQTMTLSVRTRAFRWKSFDVRRKYVDVDKDHSSRFLEDSASPSLYKNISLKIYLLSISQHNSEWFKYLYQSSLSLPSQAYQHCRLCWILLLKRSGKWLLSMWETLTMTRKMRPIDHFFKIWS